MSAGPKAKAYHKTAEEWGRLARTLSDCLRHNDKTELTEADIPKAAASLAISKFGDEAKHRSYAIDDEKRRRQCLEYAGTNVRDAADLLELDRNKEDTLTNDAKEKVNELLDLEMEWREEKKG